MIRAGKGRFSKLIHRENNKVRIVTTHQSRQQLTSFQVCQNGLLQKTVATFQGTVMRVQARLSGSLPCNAWVQDGTLTDTGPNLPLVALNV